MRSHLEHRACFIFKSQMVKILVFHKYFVYVTSPLSQQNQTEALQYKDTDFRYVCLNV